MKKIIVSVLFVCGFSLWGQVDKATKALALQRYLGSAKSPQLADAIAAWNKAAPGTRPVSDPSGLNLESLLPTRRAHSFVAYIMATRYNPLGSFAQQVAAGQLNKMLGSTAGNSGTTTLLSSSVAADVLSLATEYGTINETTSGNTTTARGNLAGIAGLFAGNPYLGCNSLAVGCSTPSRWARSFSTSISVETDASSGTQQVSGTNAATGAPATTGILASGNRMSAWNVRYDYFHKTLYDTKNVKGWAQAMEKVAASSDETELDKTVPAVIANLTTLSTWRESFLAALQNAPAGRLLDALQQQLDALIDELVKKNPNFMAQVEAAQNAIDASFLQRDDVLRQLQTQNVSVEFNSLHPLGQPNLSNIRVIYSYQPPKGSLLLTFNGASEWYDSVPSGVKVGRLRDLQAAAQVDRPLGTIPQFGKAVLTVGFYYQWMRDAALISIPAGDTAPGTGIILPGAASTLLATKGPIAIGQAKVTLPIKSGVIKVPISFTWSNRTELINESEKRAQIGLTLDLDSIFQK
jgi:hypothetical protein